MERYEVIKVICGERNYQDTTRIEKVKKRDQDLGIKSDIATPDSRKSVSAFLIYIEEHLQSAKKMIYISGDQAALHEVRKIGALCIAAGEAFGLPERVTKDETS